MSTRFRIVSLFIFLCLLNILVNGCSGAKRMPIVSGPEWSKKGAGAFLDKDANAFYGVGGVTGIRNIPLATTAADNRARAEIGKIFETYTASLMKDYAASTTAGDFKKSSEEQHVEQAIKTFSATTLSGVMIIDHWTDSQNDILYSLARLDLTRFKGDLDKMKELNSEMRDYVRKNADKSFKDLAAEEGKK